MTEHRSQTSLQHRLRRLGTEELRRAEEILGLRLSELPDLDELHRLAADAEGDVQQEAIWLLGQIGLRSSSGRVLGELLGTAGDAGIRRSTCDALGMLGGRAARRALVTALDNDSSSSVRAAAARALGFVRGPGSVEALVRAIETDTSEEVLDDATEMLGIVGQQGEVPLLVRLLDHRSARVRYSAAYSIGLIGSPAEVSRLRRVEAEDTDVINPVMGSVADEARRSIDRIELRGRREGR